MHDIHLANQIAKIIQNYAQKNGLRQIKKVSLELGSIIEHGQAIESENLKYNINLLLPKVEIEVKSIKGDEWKLVSIEGEPM